MALQRAHWIALRYLLMFMLSPALGSSKVREAGASKAQQLLGASVHTVITTECSAYFDWQSLGLVYRYAVSTSASLLPICPALHIRVTQHAALQCSVVQQLPAGCKQELTPCNYVHLYGLHLNNGSGG